MNSSVRQGLTADISKDALELTIEDMTGVDIKKVTYQAGKTEAIVQLDDSIIFDSEKPCTISGRKVNIVAITTKHKPNFHAEIPEEKHEERPVVPIVRAAPTPRVSVVRAQEKPTVSKVRAADISGGRAQEKPTVSKVRAAEISGGRAQEKPTVSKVRAAGISGGRAQEKPTVSKVRAAEISGDRAGEKSTAPVVRAQEKAVVSGNRAVNVDVIAQCSEDVPKETTELVKFPSVKRDLLKMLLPELQALLPNCSLKTNAEGIELKGPAEAVTQAKLHISEQVFRFKIRTIEGNSQRVRLLQSDKSQQQVQELFLKAGIQAVLSVRDDQLWLTAADDEQKSQASRVLERNIQRNEIPVDDFHQEFLQSAQWKEFIKDLERNYNVTVERETSSVVIDALGDCSEDLLKQVRDKLEDNAQQSNDILLTEEQWELLKTCHQTEVEDIGRKKTG